MRRKKVEKEEGKKKEKDGGRHTWAWERGPPPP